MRFLPNVLNDILVAIPETENDLISNLKSVQQSSSYAAPEMQPMWWNKAYEILIAFVFAKDIWKDLDWQEEVRKIWTNEK